MSIEYTNSEKIISDELMDIIKTEFDFIDAVFEDKFQLQRLAERGEYIRVWPGVTDLVSLNSDGETRDYPFQVVHYFDQDKYRKQKDWDNLYSARSARFRQLARDKHYCAPAGQNLELTFDAGDFLIVPTLANLSTFDTTFEFYIPNLAGDGVFSFQNSDNSKNWSLSIGSTTSLRFSEDGAAKFTATVSNQAYFTCRFRYDGTKVYIDIDGVNAGSHIAVNSLSNFTHCTICGAYAGGSYFGGSDNGKKMKNLVGTYEFGIAYTEVARSNIAVATDTVGSIENNGTAGGYLIQPTASSEPTLTSIINTTDYKWHNLSLQDSSPPMLISEFEDIGDETLDGKYGIVHNITITRSNF